MSKSFGRGKYALALLHALNTPSPGELVCRQSNSMDVCGFSLANATPDSGLIINGRTWHRKGENEIALETELRDSLLRGEDIRPQNYRQVYRAYISFNIHRQRGYMSGLSVEIWPLLQSRTICLLPAVLRVSKDARQPDYCYCPHVVPQFQDLSGAGGVSFLPWMDICHGPCVSMSPALLDGSIRFIALAALLSACPDNAQRHY